MKYSSRQQPNKHWLLKVDWILVAIITLLAILSDTLISSAMGGGQYSANFGIRQILYYILGAIMAIIIMFISPKNKKLYIFALWNFLHIIIRTFNIARNTYHTSY